MVGTEVRLPIATDTDVVTARQQGRAVAERVGLPSISLTLIATAISEVARNIINYAGRGEILIDALHENGRRGVVVIARDEGPGIPDVALAMQDGYTTGTGLGLGLPGARRLMDEFELVSEVGKGTTVTMKKWAR